MTVNELPPALAEALDRLAIQQVIAAYSEAIDSRDWDALDRVFTADAVIDYTEMGGIRGDLPAISAFLDRFLGVDGPYARTQHLLGQSYVEVRGDDATARTACFNPMVLGGRSAGDGDEEVVYFCGLWYRDTLVRTAGGWRITERYEQRAYKYGKAAADSEGVTVDELLAKQAIAEGLYRYCRSLDRMDATLYGTVFEPGARIDYGEHFVGTAEGFREWVWRLQAGMAAHSHQITNILTQLDLSASSAVSEAYVTVCLRMKPDEAGSVLDLVERGRYLDRWTRGSDGSWRIVDRQYRGDIQHAVDATNSPAMEAIRDRTDPSYTHFAEGSHLLDAPTGIITTPQDLTS